MQREGQGSTIWSCSQTTPSAVPSTLQALVSKQWNCTSQYRHASSHSVALVNPRSSSSMHQWTPRNLTSASITTIAAWARMLSSYRTNLSNIASSSATRWPITYKSSTRSRSSGCSASLWRMITRQSGSPSLIRLFSDAFPRRKKTSKQLNKSPTLTRTIRRSLCAY